MKNEKYEMGPLKRRTLEGPLRKAETMKRALEGPL
jgi:hypothetical protein